MIESSSPIEIEVTAADPARGLTPQPLKTFSSYSFDRNLMVPASPFRFTAEGVDRAVRKSIRSADTVELYVKNSEGQSVQLATGFIDETDTHVTPTGVSYLLTGRDTIGQLVDNAAVDSSNRIIHAGQSELTLLGLAQQLRLGTRIPSPVKSQRAPQAPILFQTNPGETKVNALQRYLEYTNCLVWSLPNGQMVVGKPNMAQAPMGELRLSYSDPARNNCLEARSRRNTNTAIRKIAVQLQALSITDPSLITQVNADREVRKVSGSLAGRSVYRLFSQGNGTDAVNQLVQVGNSSTPQQIGYTLARRELAQSNMQVLEAEIVVKGHINDSGVPYQIDQVYSVFIEDDDVAENMYVYAAKYDMTKDRGRTTTLRLVRLGTIVADVPVR
jgi:prophage tail gpP-like protein